MAKTVKTQNNIPSTKVQRAAKFMRTGVKVGGNYVKHYARKVVNPEVKKDDLHEDNARDIYDTLSELKGSALKVAQMMSMDRNLLPSQYSQRFQMAQYSAPPLSFPLVVRTFRQAFGKSPDQLFDTFTKDAVNAASIGQVHQATLGEKKLAVKIQYPGVADSVKSDLRIVKPFAVNLLRLNEQDVNHYMQEVETMLLSETDYDLELQNSVDISEATSHIDNICFPKYYPALSGKRVLTMDWLNGHHLDAFLQTNPDQETRNKIGQAMWDFYDYQIHKMKAVHADPHPGNFIMMEDGKLGIIDFGCVKVIPQKFYNDYFVLLNRDLLKEDAQMMEVLERMSFIYKDDTSSDRKELFFVFKTMVDLLGRPFGVGEFDFGNDDYFKEIYEFGEQSAEVKPLKNSKRPRGSKDGLYVNRTYFGLYSILNQLKANIQTHSQWKENEFVL